MDNKRVIVNVSGVRFEFDRKLLDDQKYHRLTTMVEEAERKRMPLQFHVDRPSESFGAILTYYQTGELHLPTGVCPGYFKKELEHWGIEQDALAECCLYKFMSFFDEMETRQKFLSETTEPAAVVPMFVPVSGGSKLKKFRERLWSIIDYREDTLIAKVYFVILMMMVLLSILNMALGTLPSLRRPLTKCEYLDYLKHKGHDDIEKVRENFGFPDCKNKLSDYDDDDFVPEDSIENLEWTDYDDYYYDFHDNHTVPDKMFRKKKISVPFLTIRKHAFEMIDYFVVAFFTMDLVLRLFSCPSLLQYFTSAVNIIEICAVAGSYVHLVVTYVEREHIYEETWIIVIDFFQVFRALRLFRIVRNVRASIVLAYSLRQNIKDVSLLVVLMLVGISTFAMLYYLFESRTDVDSIPLAWYWTIVTMTTVGYGDISPKTVGGRIIATVCACCGVLLLAVTLPVFVNNFMTLYQYSSINDVAQRAKEQKNKLRGAIHAVSLGKKLNTALKTMKTETTLASIRSKEKEDIPVIK